MKDRIRKLLLNEGLTSGAFADEIGVQRSSISHILNGRNNPSLDFVVKTINRFPNLSLSWLIIGEGSMYNTDNQSDTNSDAPALNPPTLLQAFTEQAELASEPKIDEVSENEKVTPEAIHRQVTQVLIFYSDMTFESYNPKK